MSDSIETQAIEATRRGRVHVVRVQGRLDGTTAPMLMERCTQLLNKSGFLVLDLSRVAFLGSSGVGTLLVLSEQVQEQGGAMRLAALSEAASSVAGLLELKDLFPIDATVEDAVFALRK